MAVPVCKKQPFTVVRNTILSDQLLLSLLVMTPGKTGTAIPAENFI
jgi:hypothetical protein